MGIVENALMFTKNLVDYLIEDLPPGCLGKPFRLYQSINLHKLLIFPICFVLMYLAKDWELLSLTYTAIHGTYGICWVIKDIVFPDMGFRVHQTPSGFLFSFIVLACYYVAPLLMWTELRDILPGAWGSTADPNKYTFLAGLITYIMGFMFHFCSDAQKYFTLKYRSERGLITEGFFKTSRNPNYLGELLIYIGFSLISQHAMSFAANGVLWISLFAPNITNKMKRMSRYPEWDDYTKRSALYVPSILGVIKGLPLIFFNDNGYEPSEVVETKDLEAKNPSLSL